MMALLSALASLRLTLVLLGVTGAVLLAARLLDLDVRAEVIAVPLAGLCLNLLAALAVNRRLWTHGGLLVFHLGLAALAGLGAFGRLVAFSGHVEITEGIGFEPSMVEGEAAPLHPWRFDRVRFVQGGFVIRYAPGMSRRETVTTIFVPGADGDLRPVEAGDDRPLVMQGYRFYTTFNKGFAPVLTYADAGGRQASGAIHLPTYPIMEDQQGNDWTLPDGSGEVTLWLEVPEPIYDEDGAGEFRTPENAALTVIEGERRLSLRPGETAAVGAGQIRYDGLRTWMGYKIFYDPTVRWMLAASLVATLGLGWHVARNYVLRPWNTGGPDVAEAGDAR